MSAISPGSFVVGLQLAGRRCVVVGSGEEAERRAENLRAVGARVAIVAHELADGDLDDCWLVVQTDRDPALAARIGAACEARRIFFCATDDPQRHGFSHLAIARAGFVQIAVSTDGRAPALARRLREEIERVVRASGLAAFAERLAVLRERTPSGDRARVLGEAVRSLRLSGKLLTPDD